MEKWDSYYHSEDFETEIYAGASHVRYPYPVTQMGNHDPLGDNAQPMTATQTFTSATASGAKSCSVSVVESDPDFSPPESPISLDDEQVCLPQFRREKNVYTVCIK